MCDRGPDQRRRDRLAIVSHGVHHRDRKSFSAAQLFHHLDVAGASAPEPVIIAHHQFPHFILVTKAMAERRCIELRDFFRERHQHVLFDALRRDELALLLRQRQQLRRRRWIHDRQRMRVERHEHAGPAARPRPPEHFREDRLMAAVHAIERSQCDDCSLHHSSATTTRGFKTSPTHSATPSNSSSAKRATRPCASPPDVSARPCTTASRSVRLTFRRGKSATKIDASRTAAGVTASGATASSSRNGPTVVRRSAERCAPHPSAAPMSRARDRRYVPPLTVARNSRSGTAASTISSSRISTGRAAGSTVSPRRARRYARSPSIFTAEYAGGRCSYRPRNLPITSASCDGVIPVQGAVATPEPVTSSVPVVTPSRMTPSYDFGHSVAKVASRVARPTTSTSNPLGNGSSVPRWPTRCSPSVRRTISTTS